MDLNVRRRSAGWFVPLVVATLLPMAFPGPAGAEKATLRQDGLSFGGSLRFLSAYNSYAELEPFFPDSQTFARSLLRLTFGGRLAPAIAFDIHVVPYADYDSEPEAGVFKPRIGNPRYHVPGGSWERSRGSWRGGIWVDRFNVRISLPWADLTVGRQAVTFGKAYFWNPLDVIYPFQAWEFDREYKEGADAVRLDIPMGRVTGLNLVAAPGREVVLREDFKDRLSRGGLSWYGSALLARFYTTVRNGDVSVQAGKVYGGYHVGGGFSGESASINVRFEAAAFLADRSRLRPLPHPLENNLLENHVSAVMGLGWRFPSGLDFNMEYFYNGAARAKFIEGALLRMVHGSNTHLSTQLLGAAFKYPVTPILDARLTWILSIPDHSFLLQPHLSLSLSNEANLDAGAAFGVGDAPFLFDSKVPFFRTEFGTYPDVVYILLRIYF